MLRNFLIVCLLSFNVILFAQDNTISVQLTRNETILDSKDLGDSGFIIKTGKNYMNSKKLGWKL